MVKRTINAIHNLRIFFSALIFISFLALIGLNPVNIAEFITTRIGLAVENGNRTTAKVEPNPYNTLAMQLRDKETGLDEREKLLNQKEEELLSINASQKKIITILAFGILLLFGLILLNYYLDYKRRQKDKG